MATLRVMPICIGIVSHTIISEIIQGLIYHRLLHTQQTLNLLNLEAFDINEVQNTGFEVMGDVAAWHQYVV